MNRDRKGYLKVKGDHLKMYMNLHNGCAITLHAF